MKPLPHSDFRSRTAWIYVVSFGGWAWFEWHREPVLAKISLAAFILALVGVVSFRMQYKHADAGWVKR